VKQKRSVDGRAARFVTKVSAAETEVGAAVVKDPGVRRIIGKQTRQTGSAACHIKK